MKQTEEGLYIIQHKFLGYTCTWHTKTPCPTIHKNYGVDKGPFTDYTSTQWQTIRCTEIVNDVEVEVPMITLSY
jgi:hypothetical protein